MRVNRVLLVALAISLAAAPSAQAAKRKPKPKPLKPTCNLLLDDAKDDGDSNSLPLVESPLLDILSGDIATSKNEMVAVLRLKSVNPAGDNWTRLGYNWAFGVNGSGTMYAFRAKLAGSGDWSASVTVGDTVVTSTFTRDAATNSFIWHVPRKGVKAMARPKLVWKNFNANSNVFSGTADNVANPNSTYPDLYPSCVKAK